MNNFEKPAIKTSAKVSPKNEPEILPKLKTAEAEQTTMEFFERNRAVFEQMAGSQITVEPSKKDTFYVDLEKGVVGVSERFYQNAESKLSKEEREQATVFAVAHEVGHLEEMMDILKTPEGIANFETYLGRLKKDRAFATLDNCVSDNRQNDAVTEKIHQGFETVRRTTYDKDLFQSLDFTQSPRHIQFSQTLLVEGQFPDKKCTVAPEVREAVDRVLSAKTKTGKNLFKLTTSTALPMEMRWKLQDKFVVPEMEKLKEQDIEDRKNPPENASGQSGDDHGDQNNQPPENQPGEQDKSQLSQGQDDQNQNSSSDKSSGEPKSTQGPSDGLGEIDPNDYLNLIMMLLTKNFLNPSQLNKKKAS